MNSSTTNLQNPIEKCFKRLTAYHYYFFFLLFLAKLPVFWHVLNLIFLSPPMEYDCADQDNPGKNVCPCKDPVWNRSIFTETMHTKFNIYCDRLWLISFSQSMLYFGTLIGSMIFGFLADKFGRLSMFCLCCLILGIFGCLVTVMPTITTYTLMRFFEGVGLGGSIVTSYVLCVEFCSTQHREVVTALYHIPINFSHMTLAGISYLLRHCDEFQLATSVPIFLFVLMRCLVYESPKWLMDIGEIDKAATIMQKIDKFNKTENETIRTDIAEYYDVKSNATHQKIKFWQLFKHKQLSINLLCLSFIYLVCGMGYYGVSQYIGLMSGDIFINVSISGLLLLPGTVASVFLLKICGRRSFLMSTTLLSGIFMLIVVGIPEDHAWIRVGFACICNCFFFMSFIIVFLYGVELFPTSCRNSVLGFLCVLARVGQIIAPFINATSKIAAGSVFGVCAILAGAACIPLPETKNQELPSSLEDSTTLPRSSLPDAIKLHKSRVED